MWTAEQLEQYFAQGFLLCRGLVRHEEIATLCRSMPELLDGHEQRDHMHREYERSGAVRQVYLAHRYCKPYKQLSADSRLVDPIKQIIGNDVYIWHSKLNVKDAFEGTVWLWHQDYGYWMWDGVDPRIVSVMVFIDRATVNSGCLLIVPGSHKWGRQEHYVDTSTTSYKQWCIDAETLKQKLKDDQIQHIVGEPGDTLFFDCNLVHGSNHNMSPLPRRSWIVAYNDIDNKPRPVPNPRPDWAVSRRFEPIQEQTAI